MAAAPDQIAVQINAVSAAVAAQKAMEADIESTTSGPDQAAVTRAAVALLVGAVYPADHPLSQAACADLTGGAAV